MTAAPAYAVPGVPAPHPVLDAVADVLAAVDHLRTTSRAGLTTDERMAVIDGLDAAVDKTRAVVFEALAEGEDLPVTNGARSIAAWWTHRHRGHRPADAAAVRLATELHTTWRGLRRAFGAGKVTEAQARVIVTALGKLPEELDPAVPALAEKALVELAADHDCAALKILGDRILQVVAPDLADEADRKRLEAEEAAAGKRTSLTFRHRWAGTTEISAIVPDATAARLKTFLESLTAPAQQRLRDKAAADAQADPGLDTGDPDEAGQVEAGQVEAGRVGPAGPQVPAELDRRPYDQKLGEAFCALLERFPTDLLPQHGGGATSVVVHIDHEALLTGLGTATLATGGRISAAEARRLACEAEILPAVLNGKSEVLDLGRAQRLFTAAQRIAAGIKKTTCQAAGCDVPAPWCHAHHWRAWLLGGKTDLEDLVLLCSHHHGKVHHPRYGAQLTPDGVVTFHRRT